MRGILINPTLQTISEAELPDHYFLLQRSINKALECDSTVGLTDESDTVQLITDARRFDGNHLGMHIATATLIHSLATFSFFAGAKLTSNLYHYLPGYLQTLSR